MPTPTPSSLADWLRANPHRKIGLALGSGGARGGAHLGVLQALAELGIRPHCIAGTSIGALVGAFAAAGRADRLFDLAERFADWRELGRFFFEVSPALDGLYDGKRVMRELSDLLGVETFEALPTPFAAVATDLLTGREAVFTAGPLARAIRASIAIPGVFRPVHDGTRLLVDGGLSNPVPVTACRALGADFVIAVDIAQLPSNPATPASPPLTPPLADILVRTIRLFEARVAADRLALDAPDILVTPPVAHLFTHDFHHLRDIIPLGRAAALAAFSSFPPPP